MFPGGDVSEFEIAVLLLALLVLVLVRLAWGPNH
ncbi:hypothetical protein J2S53_002547 [Actinopolyspora lacussalsi]|nr:hypothetical protein [Actinopolyspora lacussalsi]